MFSRLLLACAICLAPLTAPSGAPASARHASGGSPALILWAWERPEDLRFIDTSRVGVAFLARTLRLHDDEVLVRPRLQPISVADGTYLTAVVRVESGEARPTLSARQREFAAGAIAGAARDGVRGIQIDFDATTGERDFYRDLIHRVRERVPGLPLSITALASWCAGDRWIAGLPIDDAVPMLFRMGADRAAILRHLRDRRGFDEPPCGRSLGISTDEWIHAMPVAARTYVFSPVPWTAAALRDVEARLR